MICNSSAGSSKRRYNVTVLGLMLIYALLLLAANAWVPLAGSPLRKLALAVLPALPIIGVFAAMGRFLVNLRDEYQRMLLVRQMLIATALLLSLATIWGFAEDFDVLPHVPAYYAAILWFGGMGFGSCVNAWIERHGVAE